MTGEVLDDGNDELSPENYPRAARVLAEDFYWDCTDEFSPFGNDDGADALALFRQWRAENPISHPLEFLDELLQSWEVDNCNWDVVDATEAVRLINEDEFSFRARDNCVIAVAFAQILFDEVIDSEIKRRVLLAINRQLLPKILNKLLGEAHFAEFTEKMTKMKTVLVSQ